ncbi:hypothetical protein BCEP4_70057 [Burkholderia cepacia]|nr:hypothetical protein BCEP4_70057 [Burkholderia cepacia]
MSPIKKCGRRAPRNGAVRESTGSKERDVAVDRNGTRDGGAARRQATGGMTGGMTGEPVRARQG